MDKDLLILVKLQLRSSLQRERGMKVAHKIKTAIKKRKPIELFVVFYSGK
jgi:hypothetical protein